MSGFVAATCSHDQPHLQLDLVEMSKTMEYRGDLQTPAVFSDRSAAVARYRDHTGVRVDTYANERFAIVLDGCIFNRQELISTIGADKSAGIAQVVLEGFEKKGDRWFAALDGSFAVMIVDLRCHETILARDRFGHRPLYFGFGKSNTWVANEIKTILAAPGFERSINEYDLYSSIGFGVTPGPGTLIKGVFKCVPGFVFRISNNGEYHTTDYLSLTVSSRLDLGIGEAKEFILATLREHIESYISVCPNLGVLLSGGIDSSLIAYLAAEAGNQNNVAIGFGASDWPGDESGEACQMAERLGLEFVRTNTSPNDDLLGSLRRVVRHLEDPTRFENALPFEIGSRVVSGKCTALMTGEGADFILGQTDDAVIARLYQIRRIPAFLRAAIGSLPLERIPVSKIRALASYLKWQSFRDYGDRTVANCCNLVPGGNNDRPPKNEIVSMLSDIGSEWPIGAQFTYSELRDFGHCWVERMEKISAGAGLECFHAFENNKMFQFGLELPHQLRTANGIHKPALRSLAADLFGDEVAYRKKRQLAAPMQMWLNESDQLRTAVMNLRKSDSRIRAYLDNDVVNQYLDQYESQGAQSESISVPLFRMLAFEIWLKEFM